MILLLSFCALTVLSSCNTTKAVFGGIKDLEPVPAKLIKEMRKLDMPINAPIMIRVIKSEDLLEVWKQKRNGRYALLAEYKVCQWSGKIGPKFKEGDRQTPEGFYTVNRHQLNPHSKYYLAFNIGFPNAYDRSHGRTGSNIMVHGACSSAGCFSMTDHNIREIYALARDALNAGQKNFQVQSFPFRMTAKNMAKQYNSPHYNYWEMIRRGYDMFEITKRPPVVNVCEKKYRFNVTAANGGRFSARSKCPEMRMNTRIAAEYLAHEKRYQKAFSKALSRETGAPKRKVNKLSFADVLPGITIGEPVITAKSTDQEKPFIPNVRTVKAKETTSQ
jgi:murein L,D-transpeptidase YafK